MRAEDGRELLDIAVDTAVELAAQPPGGVYMRLRSLIARDEFDSANAGIALAALCLSTSTENCAIISNGGTAQASFSMIETYGLEDRRRATASQAALFLEAVGRNVCPEPWPRGWQIIEVS
jgi:hypothetical protein